MTKVQRKDLQGRIRNAILATLCEIDWKEYKGGRKIKVIIKENVEVFSKRD